MVGQTISHYRIVEKLGEGGMGVVYKAEDLKLGRVVALKFLKAEALDDEDSKRRFVREARAAARLEHSNVCAVYDIDEQNGQTFLAMSFVEGESIREKIARRPLRLDEALDYALQAAQGLQAAHEKGIVHRDIKSANLMVTHKGQLKVMDFGLAQLANQSQITKTATLLGTPAYMSPEQARREPTDHRTDIWSLGAVIYEMVTGRLPFAGERQEAVLYAIGNEAPEPITALRAGLPMELERTVGKSLAKEPEERYQHVDEMLVDLRQIRKQIDAEPAGRLSAAREGSGGGAEIPSIADRGGRRWLTPVAAAALLVIIVAVWLSFQEPATAPAWVVTRLTSDSGLTTEPALSRDGRLVAYASDRAGDGNLDIWVQQIPGGEAIQLTRDPADDREPGFSPDGQRIVFRSERDGGGIYIMSAIGGGIERLLAPDGRRPRFSPDGAKIAYWTGARGGYNVGEIFLVDASGGPSQPVKVGLPLAQSPVWSPDGKHILFVGSPQASYAGSDDWDWWIYPVDGGEAVSTGARKVLEESGITDFREPGLWLTRGRVVFSATLGDSTNLWEVSLSSATGRIEGSPRQLTTGAGPELYPTADGSGRLVFANQVENRDVWWLPIEVNQGKVIGEPQRLTQAAASDVKARISADSARLLFISDRSGNDDLWIKDLAQGEETALTQTAANESSAQFCGDGSVVVSNESGALHVVSASQSGVPQQVCEQCGNVHDCSSDGRWVLHPAEPAGIGLFDTATRETIEVIAHPKRVFFMSSFSPDDRWVAFHESTGSASRRIYVAPFRGSTPIPQSDWVPITDGTGLDRDAWWSPDGSLLYFYSERDGFRCIWAQRLQPQTKRPVGEMFAVYHMHHARRSTMAFADLSEARLSTAPGKLVFAMGEHSGNIWMAAGQER